MEKNKNFLDASSSVDERRNWNGNERAASLMKLGRINWYFLIGSNQTMLISRQKKIWHPSKRSSRISEQLEPKLKSNSKITHIDAFEQRTDHPASIYFRSRDLETFCFFVNLRQTTSNRSWCFVPEVSLIIEYRSEPIGSDQIREKPACMLDKKSRVELLQNIDKQKIHFKFTAINSIDLSINMFQFNNCHYSETHSPVFPITRPKTPNGN